MPMALKIVWDTPNPVQSMADPYFYRTDGRSCLLSGMTNQASK
jgi:hypothetical protein